MYINFVKKIISDKKKEIEIKWRNKSKTIFLGRNMIFNYKPNKNSRNRTKTIKQMS